VNIITSPSSSSSSIPTSPLSRSLSSIPLSSSLPSSSLPSSSLPLPPSSSLYKNNYTYDDTELIQVWLTLDKLNDTTDDTNNSNSSSNDNRIFGIKVNSLVKIIKVLLGFPFVVVVSSLNVSSSINIILRSVYTIRLMNILMYGLPLILVYLGIIIIAIIIIIIIIIIMVVLKSYDVIAQDIAIGLYIGLYILPIAFVVLSKVLQLLTKRLLLLLLLTIILSIDGINIINPRWYLLFQTSRFSKLHIR